MVSPQKALLGHPALLGTKGTKDEERDIDRSRAATYAMPIEPHRRWGRDGRVKDDVVEVKVA